MRGVTQTILHSDDPQAERGNCFQACVATIFNVPLDDVPHFCRNENSDGGKWFLEFEEWCNARGFEPVIIDRKHSGLWHGDSVHIVSGIGPRGVLHSCVGKDAQIVFDPHPSRSGLTDIKDYIVFVALDPSRMNCETEALAHG